MPHPAVDSAMTQLPPPVLVISSFVVRGAVGARAAFALERRGHRVWTLPTVILPWHPGHGRSHRLALADGDFAALAADLAGAPWLGEIGAVITGYLGSPAQARIAVDLIAAVKAANPRALHVADPVIGDDGGLYVEAAIAQAQRDHLLASADVATPNRFELGWLTGRPVDGLAAIAEAARALGPARVAVTSAPAMMRGKIAALLISPQAAVIAENPLLAGAPNGSGDLFSALLTSHLLQGADEEAALAAAAASTFEVIARSVRAGGDELDLAGAQTALVQPSAPVDIRHLGGSGGRARAAARGAG